MENIVWLKSKIKTPPLSQQEEQALFKLIRAGSRSARDRLVEANLKFVIQVAREYSNDSLCETDLVNEGTLGLLRAIETFDDTRGLKFITYAVWWIRAYITRSIQDKGSLVRLPANKCDELRKGNKTGILSEDLKIWQKPILSLSSELNDDSSIMLIDTIPDQPDEYADKQVDLHNLNKLLGKFAHKLSKREQDVIGSLYGTRNRKRKNIVEISKMIGVSRERIRQIRDQGIKRIAALNDDGHYNKQLSEFYAIANK